MPLEKLSRRKQELADYRREGFLPSGKLDLTTLNIDQVHHLIDLNIDRAVSKVDDGKKINIHDLSTSACTLLGYFIEFGRGQWVADKFADQPIDIESFAVPKDNNQWHLLLSLIEYGGQAAWVASHIDKIKVTTLNSLSLATKAVLASLIQHGQSGAVLQKFPSWCIITVL